MIRFYLHYDKESHKGKLHVYNSPDNATESRVLLVDSITILVLTKTRLSDTPPKFVIVGECLYVFGDGEKEAVLSDIYLDSLKLLLI
jgi:hypothetical protein